MVMGFFEALKASQKAAYSYVHGAVSEGMSINASLNAYRAIGGAIRDTLYADLYHMFTGAEKGAYEANKVPLQYYPDSDRFTTAATEIPSNFMYIGTVGESGSYREDGTPILQTIAINSDEPLTHQGILDEIGDIYISDTEKYHVTEYEPSIIEIYKAGE